MKTQHARLILGSLLLIHLTSYAGEFEKLGTAVERTLGTKKAAKKTLKIDGKDTTVFFAKGKDGKATKYAVLQKGIYEPDCSHTWVVGIDAKSLAVDQIRVVEMSCPHAFPTKENSFLDQYKGKGPADVKKLKDEIGTIAKATGSSNLTTDAVIRSVKACEQLKKDNT